MSTITTPAGRAADAVSRTAARRPADHRRRHGRGPCASPPASCGSWSAVAPRRLGGSGRPGRDWYAARQVEPANAAALAAAKQLAVNFVTVDYTQGRRGHRPGQGRGHRRVPQELHRPPGGPAKVLVANKTRSRCSGPRPPSSRVTTTRRWPSSASSRPRRTPPSPTARPRPTGCGSSLRKVGRGRGRWRTLSSSADTKARTRPGGRAAVPRPRHTGPRTRGARDPVAPADRSRPPRRPRPSRRRRRAPACRTSGRHPGTSEDADRAVGRRWLAPVVALVAALALLGAVAGRLAARHRRPGERRRARRPARPRTSDRADAELQLQDASTPQAAQIEGPATGSFKDEFGAAMGTDIKPLAVKNQTRRAGQGRPTSA